MRLRLVTWLAAILLFGGGVVFAILGFRALRLEQHEGERRAAERTQRALARAVADAERLARLPSGPPLEAWRIEPLTIAGASGPKTEEDLRRLRQARQLAAVQADDQRAYEIWSGLADQDGAPWLRQSAAFQAGVLAHRLDRIADAERHLEVAAGAQDPLVSHDGVRVRLGALEQLAECGLREGRSQPTVRFLGEVQDGERLADGPVGGGPDGILTVLRARIAGGEVPRPSPDVAARLDQAADHAEQGQFRLIAMPQNGVRFIEDRLVLRKGDRLQTRPLSSLVEPPPAGFAPQVEVLVLRPEAVLEPHTARLAPPLQALVLRVMPEAAGSRGTAALLALIAGLALYAFGAFLAIGALRRSRRAARMQRDFVAAVSHEMKTPIASVRAMAELLAGAETLDPERARQYAGRIEGEMQRLGDTVHNVLDAAQIERLGTLPVHLRPGDPALVVQAAVDAVRPDLERRGFELTCEIAPLGGMLPLDPEALRGVLLNLLDNAAKYSDERREVRVEAGPSVGDGHGYEIAVLDRGRGLDSGKHEHLFRRFHRGAGARRHAVPGVGLGLHVARSVVEAHGGRLWAEARDGGGAAFRIELQGTES